MLWLRIKILREAVKELVKLSLPLLNGEFFKSFLPDSLAGSAFVM